MKTTSQYRFQDIDINEINVPEYVARDKGTKEMDQLTQSIKQHGHLAPLLVNELDDGEIKLIGGSRRLEALRREHYKRVSCKIFSVPEDVARVLALADNIHRKDYNVKELAEIYGQLVEAVDGDIDEAARMVAKAPAEIKKVLKARMLSDTILEKTKEIQDTPTRRTVEELLPMVAKDERKVAAVKIIKDRFADEFDARKIIKAIRQNPHLDPVAAVNAEFDVPANLIGMQVKLTIDVNEALGHAAIEKRKPRNVVAADYIQRCLKQDGYLVANKAKADTEDDGHGPQSKRPKPRIEDDSED